MFSGQAMSHFGPDGGPEDSQSGYAARLDEPLPYAFCALSYVFEEKVEDEAMLKSFYDPLSELAIEMINACIEQIK